MIIRGCRSGIAIWRRKDETHNRRLSFSHVVKLRVESASPSRSDDDKVWVNEGVPWLLARIAGNELPDANNATLELFCVRSTTELGSTESEVSRCPA